MATVHPAFDEFFDKLVLLLKDQESFDADVLENQDWKDRFDALVLAIKVANRNLSQGAARLQFLAGSIFVAEESDRWIDTDNYLAYLKLWDEALTAGYIPDSVCSTGPSPTEIWVPIMATPSKSLGKRHVSPSGHSVTITSSPLPTLTQIGAAVPVPPAVPAYAPPQIGVAAPATPTVPAYAPIPSASLLAPNPQSQDVVDAMRNFLLGGTTGGTLPTSANTGTSNTPTSSSSLPSLNVVPNPWVAPASQQIYDLNKFHQSYVEVEDKFVLNSDGTISTKKSGKKIATPSEWIAATQNFGLALSASPEAHQFTWSDFMLWIQHMTVLFRKSVV